ncbi:MAG: hypothetical protein B6D70_14545 [gamma proteobacterium symbiont of Stewartia floridana]|nr:MAG: hypothetical protein B6D76_04765 [gamma proteobacterium symbiont of Stewartia floridana]RLW57666.1 MAG: hypothetical protein B6D70_14545 [gamma proteobacterium symbiont of Stewartia floridana]RLW57903.1 MAG: hypothetical protein B6D75_15725 [gamma proteobacterium symbiont of Stewartia floridana]
MLFGRIPRIRFSRRNAIGIVLINPMVSKCLRILSRNKFRCRYADQETLQESGEMRVGLLLLLCFVVPLGGAVELAPESQALLAAATSGEVDRVNDLLSQGVDVNTKNPTGRSVLHIAAFNGNLQTVRALLAAGADANLADGAGLTPLMEAASFGHLEVVRLLIQRGADVNAADQAGNTPLTLSNRGRHTEVSALLTEMGATEGGGKEEKK